MAKQISITVSEGTTIVKEVFNGNTKTFASNTNRNYLPVAGGVKIMPNSEETILNNYVILIADLVNDGIDFTGVATSEDLIAKLAINQAFKYGGAINKKKSVENEYATIAVMIASQIDQAQNAIQFVEDASDDATVDAGFAYYEYLGTVFGTMADYRKLSEEESMDIAPLTLQQVTDNGAITTHDVTVNNLALTQVVNDTTPIYELAFAFKGTSSPFGINAPIMDADGNMYFSRSSQYTNEIAVISVDGIDTIIDMGSYGYYSLIIHPVTDDLYILKKEDGVIIKRTRAGVTTAFANVPVINATQMVFDSSYNLFVKAYTGGGVNTLEIFKITPAGAVSVFLAEGVLSSPNLYGFEIDLADNLYFGGYNTVTRISPTEVITNFPVPDPNFITKSIVCDREGDGSMYFSSEYTNGNIFKITHEGVGYMWYDSPQPQDFDYLSIHDGKIYTSSSSYYTGMWIIDIATGLEVGQFITTGKSAFLQFNPADGNFYYVKNLDTTAPVLMKIVAATKKLLTVNENGDVIKSDDIVVKNKVILAPNALLENIIDDKALITKEYAKANYASTGAYNTTTIENITLLAINWALVAGLYEYDYANVLILANSIIEIVPYNSTIEIVKQAEILPMVTGAVGTVKLYAKYLPANDILISLNIQK